MPNMLDYGTEVMLPVGMPVSDLDGRRIRKGVPFDQVGRVISRGASDVAVVRGQYGHCYIVRAEDLQAPAANPRRQRPQPSASVPPLPAPAKIDPFKLVIVLLVVSWLLHAVR